MDGGEPGAEKAYQLPTLDELVEWVLEEPPPARNLAELLDFAAVGIVKHAWRNSPWEDVHAEPASPLTDGEMMRSNAATTRLVRELLRAFFSAVFELDVSPAGISASSTAGDGGLAMDECDFLDDFDNADLLADAMLSPLFIALTRRVLPCGFTVEESAGELFSDLEEHIAANLDRLADVTERHGLRAALYLKARAALHERWWLAPDWLELVDALPVALADPEHRHWKIGGYPDLASRPDRCGDLEQLTALLRQGPDRLTAAEAEWCVQEAAIGFVLHRIRSDAAG